MQILRYCIKYNVSIIKFFLNCKIIIIHEISLIIYKGYIKGISIIMKIGMTVMTIIMIIKVIITIVINNDNDNNNII